jgi:tetratricopeptide (TPR) repeat protein
MNRIYKVIFIAVLFLGAGYVCYKLLFDRYQFPEQEISVSDLFINNSYIGEQQCAECHKEEYAKWKTSHHYQAMLPANDSTVLGDFNDASLDADGVHSKFFKRGRKFFVSTEGRNGEQSDFEVLYTFGVYPLQQYLVALAGGKMQALRSSWDCKNKRWFDQYQGQKIVHSDWLHWTKGAQNWNTMCASCHSTNLVKNYDPRTDTYDTKWSSVNVSCEACHGPGSKHIEYVRSRKHQSEKVSGSFISMIRSDTNYVQAAACAPCHARRSTIGPNLIASHEFLDNYIPQVPSHPVYYSDGQINEEDYEYGSFLQSKMYHNGIKCSNCHEPHLGKTRFEGNRLCLQCHKPSYDSPSHHFHKAGTEGALCINCHMLRKTYMVVHERHDHSFRVPRPDLSARYGTPNTCNSCHSDKSTQWAADAVVRWYGASRKHHFADDLVNGSRGDSMAITNLLQLATDAAQPAISRAASIQYLSSGGNASSGESLLHSLADASPIVRYEVLNSLRFYSSELWQERAAPLLADPVRAVRIAAYDLISSEVPNNMPNSQYADAFAKARIEYEENLRSQLDFPVGNFMMAEYKKRRKDYQGAKEYYLNALQKDSLLHEARLNLITLYNELGENENAIRELRIAEKLQPTNWRVYYYYGLLYNELGKKAEAMKSFTKANTLSPNEERFYYNYGLFLEGTGQPALARKIYMKGRSIASKDVDLLYVLALSYMKEGKKEEAASLAAELVQLAPDNGQFKQLLLQLRAQ